MWAKYNPFNPNGLVPSNLFAGRADFCLSVLKRLSETKQGRSSSFFLHGERGIGKSALAGLIADVAKSSDPKLYDLNFVTVYYPIEPEQDFRSVLESTLNSMTDSLPGMWLDRIKSRLGNLLKNGRFSLGYCGIEGSIESSSPEAKRVLVRDQAISALSNIVQVLREGEEKRDGILIIIDEFQNLKDIEVAAPMLRGILSALDFNKIAHVSFMLVGLDQAYEDFIEGDVSARRSFESVRLDVMPTKEAMEVLIKGFNDVQVKWEQPLLESNILMTGGYPHSIQVVGHNLVDIDNDGMIDSGDWADAITKASAELRDKEFSEMYGFGKALKGAEKVLNVLALFGHMTKKELVKKCKDNYALANPYQYLTPLQMAGAIRVLPDTQVELHSKLFRAAILLTILPTMDHSSKIFQNWMASMEKSEKAPESGGASTPNPNG